MMAVSGDDCERSAQLSYFRKAVVQSYITTLPSAVNLCGGFVRYQRTQHPVFSYGLGLEGLGAELSSLAASICKTGSPTGRGKTSFAATT